MSLLANLTGQDSILIWFSVILRVTKTPAAWQHWCAKKLAVWWILWKFSPKFIFFLFFFLQISLYVSFFLTYSVKKMWFYCKVLTKIYDNYLEIFHNICIVKNFHKILLGWKISKTNYVALKFVHSLALFENISENYVLLKI